eukprot:SAG31_NODE_2192_length_6226_cov_6.328219_3_plen_90_part_00
MGENEVRKWVKMRGDSVADLVEEREDAIESARAGRQLVRLDLVIHVGHGAALSPSTIAAYCSPTARRRRSPGPAPPPGATRLTAGAATP